MRAAAARGARVAALCVGAFVLAAAGLLDGRRATTHWAYTDELARRHPAIDVDPDALYVEDGRILTSAGVTSSIDLCIHIVRTDHGDQVASATARHLVMSPHRLGGQAQFVQRDTLLAGNGDLAGTLRWLEAHLAGEIGLTEIARHAGTSRRSVTRHFRDQTGAPPLRWLLNARVERGQDPPRRDRPPRRGGRTTLGIRLRSHPPAPLHPDRGHLATPLPADLRTPRVATVPRPLQFQLR